MWAIILSSLLCGLFVALWFGSFFTLLSLEKDTSIDSTFIPYDWIVGVLGMCLLFAMLYMGYQLLHVGIISEQHERDIQSSWAMYGKMAAGGISLLWGFFMLQRKKTPLKPNKETSGEVSET